MTVPGLRDGGRRGLSLRATLLLLGLGVLGYVGAITGTLVVRIAPAADRLGRGSARVAAVSAALLTFDEGAGQAMHELHDLLLRARATGAVPDTAVTHALLVRLRALTDPMATARHLRSVAGAPPAQQAAIARALDQERLALALLVQAHAQLELGDAAAGLTTLHDAVEARRQTTDQLDHLLGDIAGGVTEREAELAAVVGTLARQMFLWCALGVVLLVGSGWAVHRRVYRPLGVLRHGLRRVAAGDLDVTLEIRRRDELGYLQEHFNQMTGVLRTRAHEARMRTHNLAERLGRVLEQSSEEIYIFDADTLRYLSVNHGAQQNLGFTTDQIVGRTPPDVLPEYDAAAFRRLLEPLRTGASDRVRLSTVHRRSDGTRYPVELSIQLSRTEAPPVFHAIAQDVSERARLRAEHDRIFDLSADLMAVADPQGTVLRVNPAWSRTLGFDRIAASRRALFDLIHPADRRLASRQIRDLYAGQPVRATAIRMRRADGEYRWIDWNMDLALDGSCYAVGRDVTNQREAEERQAALQTAVTRAAREWSLTFDALDDPVVMIDAAGMVIRANEAACRLAGVDRRAFPGRRLAELSADGLWPHAAALVQRAREHTSPVTAQIQEASSHRIWNIQVSPVHGPAAGRAFAIVVAHDVTAVVRLRDSARRNEAMAAVGALVAGVAHEVRNPLFSMTATLDAFEARTRDRPPHLSVLRTQLARLQQLMRELLEYGKPPELTLAPTALGRTLGQACDECGPLALQHGVEVQCATPDDLPPVRGDHARLVQVFVNLIANALQHSPAGTTVRITARAAGDPEAPGVTTLVEDEGPGFSSEDLPRVFEPFYSRRRGGTGLGLALVQRITEQHGGRVTAANREDRGAVVAVHLPLDVSHTAGQASAAG